MRTVYLQPFRIEVGVGISRLISRQWWTGRDSWKGSWREKRKRRGRKRREGKEKGREREGREEKRRKGLVRGKPTYVQVDGTMNGFGIEIGGPCLEMDWKRYW
jgi:hypothetical protein